MGWKKPKPIKASKKPAVVKNADLGYDLDPTTVLRSNTRGKRKTRQIKGDIDDTPRAFKRLMTRGKKPDVSATVSKVVQAKEKEKEETPELKIKAGESMGEFSRRVDAALPLKTIKGVNTSKAEKTRGRQRQKAENLRAEYKRQLQARHGRHDSDDDGADLDARHWKQSNRDTSPDPWAHLQAARPKFGEVADRPPELPKLKLKGGVPKAAGSQARREILEAERENVIAAYRALKNRTDH